MRDDRTTNDRFEEAEPWQPRQRRGHAIAWRVFFWLLATGFWLLATPSPSSAAPTQQDVFRSIQDNVSGEVDASTFLYILLGIIGLIVMIAVLGRQRKRVVTRR